MARNARRAPRPAPLLLVLLPGLLLGGCSSPASRAGASAAPPASTAPARRAVTVHDGAGLCALVSIAEAQKTVAMTPALTQEVPGTFVHGAPECEFASADNTTVVVNVTLFDARRDPFDLHRAIVAEGPLTPVSGLGDRAGANSAEVDVALGTHVLTLETFAEKDVSRTQLIALGRLFVARL